MKPIKGSVEELMVESRRMVQEFTEEREDGPFRIVGTFSDHVIVENGGGVRLRVERKDGRICTEQLGRKSPATTLTLDDLRLKKSYFIEQALEKLRSWTQGEIAKREPGIYRLERTRCDSPKALREALESKARYPGFYSGKFNDLLLYVESFVKDGTAERVYPLAESVFQELDLLERYERSCGSTLKAVGMEARGH
jgi:hypothetical protein